MKCQRTCITLLYKTSFVDTVHSFRASILLPYHLTRVHFLITHHIRNHCQPLKKKNSLQFSLLLLSLHTLCLKVRLVPVSFEDPQFAASYQQSVALYARYQMAIHGDDPSECSESEVLHDYFFRTYFRPQLHMLVYTHENLRLFSYFILFYFGGFPADLFFNLQ